MSTKAKSHKKSNKKAAKKPVRSYLQAIEELIKVAYDWDAPVEEWSWKTPTEIANELNELCRVVNSAKAAKAAKADKADNCADRQGLNG